MKLTAALVAAAAFLAVQLAPGWAMVALLLPPAVHLVYGLAKSTGRGLDPLNELPNTFRVLLASLAGTLPHLVTNFAGSTLGIFSFLAAVLLNDEYQRRTFYSVRRGARGGSVALLGIDGSGKSSHSLELARWFKARGYSCTRVPFHRYLFVERLASVRSAPRAAGAQRKGGHPLRPALSAVDNLLLYLISSLGTGIEGRVVLYDRYIWSTLVKYEALGYPVAPVRWAYTLPSPRYAVVLDIPVSKSMGVISGRPDHIRYAREVLEFERSRYLGMAREKGLPVVDATRSFAEVQGELETLLSRIFPSIKGGA